jgi:hypothetical protein
VPSIITMPFAPNDACCSRLWENWNELPTACAGAGSRARVVDARTPAATTARVRGVRRERAGPVGRELWDMVISWVWMVALHTLEAAA